MLKPPADFDKLAADSLRMAHAIEGQPRDAEVRFLALATACPTAEGVVLEIGSYLGRSTVVLGNAIRSIGGGTIVSVDPLTSPSSTDPDLKGKQSIRDE